MTPLLTLVFGIHPSIAVGTDLAFACLTKISGTLVHRSKKTVHWPIVGLLSLGALPAAMLSAFTLKYYGGLSPEIGQIIRYAIAISLFLTVIALLFRRTLHTWLNRHPEKQLQGKSLARATILAGLILGILVSISSIGAGAIGATILVLLYPRLTPAEIAGTDIAYAVPLTAIAALGHWWLGSINWSLLTYLLCGSIPGIILGALVIRWISEKILRSVLAITLTAVAIKLITA